MPIHLTTRINPQKWIYKIKKFVGDGGLIVRTTTEGSFNTTPFPFIYTSMLAVPKSIPISLDIIIYFLLFA